MLKLGRADNIINVSVFPEELKRVLESMGQVIIVGIQKSNEFFSGLFNSQIPACSSSKLLPAWVRI